MRLSLNIVPLNFYIGINMPTISIYTKEVFYKRLQAIAEDLGLTVGGVVSEAIDYALEDENDFIKSIEKELPEEKEK